jgi:branched-chain amino acid transport system permease protein
MESYLTNILINCLLLFGPIGFWLCYGWSKIFNVNQICCFGLSAYCYAISTAKLNLDPIISLFLAIIIGILSNLILFLIYSFNPKVNFTILSFVLVLFFYSLVINLNDVTNGPLGIASIKTLPGSIFLYLIPFSLFAFTISYCFTNSHHGLVAKELYKYKKLTNLSINPSFTFAILLIISGGISGIGGALSASYYNYIDPSSLHYLFIVTLLLICSIVGNKPWRIFLAAGLVGIGPELLRLVQISNLHFAPIRNIIFASILIFIIFNQSTNALKNKQTK